MFRLPTRPGKDAKPLEHRRYFWLWFLTNGVMNLVDIENMTPEMETNFKFSTLIFGRTMFFTDKNGDTRALWFTNGGDVPIYPGQIVSMIVTNPVIGEYHFTTIGENLVNVSTGEPAAAVYLTMLDRMQIGAGFSDMITMFANDLAENDISVSMAQFLKRLPVIFKAKTDNDLDAARAVLNAIYNGQPELIAQIPLTNMLERMDGNSNGVAPLSEFTEYQQYKLGQFYSMLGVNTVWNLKPEKVAATENATNGETARYNIADIIDNLNDQLEQVNTIFGTDFRARLNVERAREITETVTGNEPVDEGGDNDVYAPD